MKKIINRKFFLFLTMLSYLAIDNSKARKNEDIFMSLKSSEVNLRASPSKDFVALYTYKLKYMPVKVIGGYDKWFNIVDKDGDSGWVSENLVSKIKTVITLNNIQFLYSSPDKTAIKTYKVEKNVVARLVKCKEFRCKVKIGKIKGWLDKKDIWGFVE